MRAELRRWLADRFTWWAYRLDADRFHDQAHGLAEIDRVAEGNSYRVALRTKHHYTGERDVIATDASEALKSIVGTGPWPSPAVVVLTIGEPNPDQVIADLTSVIQTERALGWREWERRRSTDTVTQEGEYARNQQEAVEHIRTLPPSERSAVANRPGQAPPSTPERA